MQPSTRRGLLDLVASLSRYAVVGATTTGLYVGLYILAAEFLATLVANLVAMVLSTIVSTEWHRAWTFHSDQRGIRTHLRAGLVTTVTYAMTSGALLALERWSPEAGELTEAAVLVAATTAAGLLRYTALRLWVFARPARLAAAVAAVTHSRADAPRALARHAARNHRPDRIPVADGDPAPRHVEHTGS